MGHFDDTDAQGGARSRAAREAAILAAASEAESAMKRFAETEVQVIVRDYVGKAAQALPARQLPGDRRWSTPDLWLAGVWMDTDDDWAQCHSFYVDSRGGLYERICDASQKTAPHVLCSHLRGIQVGADGLAHFDPEVARERLLAEMRRVLIAFSKPGANSISV